MKMKNHLQENLNSTKGYVLGKSKKERDKFRNPAESIYRIPTEQNSFSVVIHIYHSIHNKSQYHGEEYFSVR